MNDVLKPKIKYYWKFLIHYGINQFRNLLVLILLFSITLVLLSFATMFSCYYSLIFLKKVKHAHSIDRTYLDQNCQAS